MIATKINSIELLKEDPMRFNILVVFFLLLFGPLTVLGQSEFRYEKIEQGDWAVVLVRGLNLDENRELVKIEDFTKLLTENGIAPKDGWQVDQNLTYQDFAGTIGVALIYLNSKDSKKKAADFNKFLSFLDNKIGLNIAQLLASLQKNESLRNLNEGISNYLAQKESAELSENISQSTANSEASGNTKIKARFSSQARLAKKVEVTTITTIIYNLSIALNIKDEGPDNSDYWNVFSKPASPIKPYE